MLLLRSYPYNFMMIGRKMVEKIDFQFDFQIVRAIQFYNYSTALTLDQRYFRLGKIFFVKSKVSDSYHSPYCFISS